MRLLCLQENGDLGWTSDFMRDDDVPEYAILSHTWDAGQEVTFDDLKNGHAKEKAGLKKIMFCARQAAQDGWHYFWVDTCCIDKSNNTELSEAINSMFRWYQKAEVCYVYLSDISGSGLEWDGSSGPAIQMSRWFTRGWTLQELLAPAKVDFFSKEWIRLGDKQSLLQILQERTGINAQALTSNSLAMFTVEERLSWATGRETTRVEDAAYCLLGIFDVQIPLLYGEGQQKAFDRLRRELKEQISINLPFADGASYDSHAEEHGTRCLPNTRTALLHDIAHWAKSEDGKSIFWLSGMAGTGKSTIARTVAQSFAQASQLGASFFFKKGEGERGKASRFFSSIARDLVIRVPGMLPSIKKALDKDSGLLQRALKEQFEKLILSPLACSPRPHARIATQVIVIDALDECDHEDDVRAILQLLTQTRDVGFVGLRVLVTSRPELHIRLGFQQMGNGMYTDLVLHEVPKSAVEHDIRYFLEYELGAIRQMRSLPSNWPTKEQVEAVVELAVPLFIFAATVCRYVGTKGGDPETYLNRIVQYRKSTFSQLGRTYLPVLDQLLADQEEDDRELWLEDFRDLVGSIVLLDSPLSTVSLSSLLQIPQRQIESRLDALHSVLNIPSHYGSPIRLLHLSFRDFLVDPGQRKKSHFWVDEGITHGKLAARCLELMCGPNGLRQNICNLSEPGISRSDIEESKIKENISLELQYACRNWVGHLVGCQSGLEDGDAVHQFLQKHFLHWLEALSLIEEPSFFVYSRKILRLASLVTPSSSSIVSFLYDANRFVLSFSGILDEAPLQIYYSALSFAPGTSVVRQTFVDRALEPVEMLSMREADWDSSRSTHEGYSDRITAVVFSPDGKLVASASDDKTVRLWAVSTGTCFRTLKGHFYTIASVTFSKDGKLIASASDDKTVRVWEVATGSCCSTLKGHLDTVTAVAFSPDRKLVASASYDKTVRVWEVATGICCSTLKGHFDWVTAVAFSPDGQLIASASLDFTVRISEVASAICRRTLKGRSVSDQFTAVAFSPDQRLVVSLSCNGMAWIWELTTGLCFILHEGYPDWSSTVGLSPDNRVLHSDAGNIPLPFSPPSTKRAEKQIDSLHVLLKDDWIHRNQQRFVWIPTWYQITSTAIYNNLICLGRSNGNVVLLRIV